MVQRKLINVHAPCHYQGDPHREQHQLQQALVPTDASLAVLPQQTGAVLDFHLGPVPVPGRSFGFLLPGLRIEGHRNGRARLGHLGQVRGAADSLRFLDRPERQLMNSQTDQRHKPQQEDPGSNQRQQVHRAAALLAACLGALGRQQAADGGSEPRQSDCGPGPVRERAPACLQPQRPQERHAEEQQPASAINYGPRAQPSQPLQIPVREIAAHQSDVHDDAERGGRQHGRRAHGQDQPGREILAAKVLHSARDGDRTARW